MRIWPVLILPVATAVVASACGGHSSSSSSGPANDGGSGDSTLTNDGHAPDGAGTGDSATSLGDGSSNMCTPKTCAELQYTCGKNGDGCGNIIDCGTCTSPQFCGAGGFSVCGGDSSVVEAGGDVCVPKTCAALGYNCGPTGDGCGNMLECGTCTSPQYCGGGGFSQCGGDLLVLDGGSPCLPQTCQSLGANCGPQGDGCGNTIASCGTCSAPDTCGGNMMPSVCGHVPTPCTNLCPLQTQCANGTTSITGKVIAATPPQYGTPDPVPNVVVYVPNSQVNPFTPGVQCNQCNADLSGDPLVQTTTGLYGTFTLNIVPVTTSMPLVIQLGRWRKQLTVPATTACTNTVVGSITMPSNHVEGDIPLTAISTGNVDAIECVLLKMGVDQNEFSEPPSNGGTGRIQLFVGNGATGGVGDPAEGALVNTVASLSAYDEVLLPCWGDDPTLPSSPAIKTPSQQQNLVDYTTAGGRMFATHYSYVWLYDVAPFSTTAAWDINVSHYASVTANIDMSTPETTTFASWMQLINAASSASQFTVTLPYHDFDSVAAPSQRWIYTMDQESFPLQYTFDTPVGGNSECGRVVFSDFHVSSSTPTFAQTFPNECTSGPMTPQEKALEYQLWDLAACVPGPAAPVCTPLTCQQQGIACGPAGDGCGGLIQCGSCTPPETCGGSGVSGVCGYVDGGNCIPQTCAQQNFNCGPAGDGCGNQLQCGSCQPPLQCGGGGPPGLCGVVDGGSCTPRTCATLGVSCGPAGDGCGNLLMCGTCASPATCGGGGMPGKCGGGAG